jgi:hypothetical protein
LQALLPKGTAGAARNHSDCEQPQQQARSRRFHIAAIDFSTRVPYFVNYLVRPFPSLNKRGRRRRQRPPALSCTQRTPPIDL